MKKHYKKRPEQFSPSKKQSQSGTIPYRREIILTFVGLIVTCVATSAVSIELVDHVVSACKDGFFVSAISTAFFLLLILLLIYGGIVYQITRLSYLKRAQNHTLASAEDLEKIYDKKAKKLTVLVPSYKEEKRVISMTLMSAALQDYPNRNVVLLIDDPPLSTQKEDAENLLQARSIVDQMNTLFLQTRAKFILPQKKFIKHLHEGVFSPEKEIRILSDLYQEAALWHDNQARFFNAQDHAEKFFVREILEKRSDQLMVRRKEVLALPATDDVLPLIKHHYQILEALFSVVISSFERKRYENLSHAPNKAMNLNSYIGLIGKAFNERKEGGVLFLDQVFGAADFSVPDTDYIITLDADSLILPDYALRLMHFAEQPENDKIAVFQTPYSSFPGATSGKLEYTAGATTDIQYLIHQGFTVHNATFWVGANALLRKKALLDIEESDTERGYTIRRFIQDRTVIEDTESSVDLIEKNWTLYNYPERLSYSATPPDFGSLIIQRQRWANGGLIILPKLLRYFLSGKKTVSKAFEAFMRIHYLFSIAAVNISLVILLTLPLAEQVPIYWIPFTALFYFINYTRDLKFSGYKTSDIFRVYALNMLLIPVNLAGVFRSLQQAWNRKKIPFVRTPKVNGRVSTPAIYIFSVYFFTLYLMATAGCDLIKGHHLHAFFAGLNGIFMLYSIVRFVGVQNSVDDLKYFFNFPKMALPTALQKIPSLIFRWNFLAITAIVGIPFLL